VINGGVDPSPVVPVDVTTGTTNADLRSPSDGLGALVPWRIKRLESMHRSRKRPPGHEKKAPIERISLVEP
jgi:hypothetical protein